MRKNILTFLFRSGNTFREYRWSLILGCPIIALLLIMYVINSLAETPQHLEKGESVLLPPTSVHTYRNLSHSSGEVSATELVPLGLAPTDTYEVTTIAATKQKSKTNRAPARKKKPARSVSMTKVRAGTVFTANASGYTGPGKTRSGTKVRPGIVAVDPDYIPLGTVLWVEGYGECRAEDTGGSIKGNAIDLAFSSTKEALNWGRRDVQVRVISVPE